MTRTREERADRIFEEPWRFLMGFRLIRMRWLNWCIFEKRLYSLLIFHFAFASGVTARDGGTVKLSIINSST